jgi:hypothetical protein
MHSKSDIRFLFKFRTVFCCRLLFLCLVSVSSLCVCSFNLDYVVNNIPNNVSCITLFSIITLNSVFFITHFIISFNFDTLIWNDIWFSIFETWVVLRLMIYDDPISLLLFFISKIGFLYDDVTKVKNFASFFFNGLNWL